MPIAYQTLIKSDINISYPEEIGQHYNCVIKLHKSPLVKLDNYGNTISFLNNQNREVKLFSQQPFSAFAKENHFAFQVKEVVSFHWKSGSHTIYYIPGEHFTAALLKYWFLHTGLMFYFLLERRYHFLHAGAIRTGGRSLLFSAHSYGGKSTLTDYFIKQGQTMISDDKVALYMQDGRFYAVPSHPHHRPHRNIEDLGFFVRNTAMDSRPIDAIYRLQGSEADSEITLTEISGVQKFKALHFSNELRLPFSKKDDLKFLADLAKQTPIFKITIPLDLARLPEVYEAIIRHSATLKQPDR